MGTALMFPVLRRLATRLVDSVVLRRPDYDAVLTDLGRALESADTEATVVSLVAAGLQSALYASDVRSAEDPGSDTDRRAVVAGPELRARLKDPAVVAVVTIRTVEPPHPTLEVGALAAGRRLLSDDRHLLEAASRLAARRIDVLRVAQERLERNIREQQMRRLATEAELRALRAQLNPHFLFNALTTIGYLIQTAPPRALGTLMRLTSVLRAVLRRSAAEFSTLGDEIDLITAYLEIEHARFEERLRVSIEVPTSSRDVLVPTLLLQPLVENAVKHGVGPRLAGGSVRIAAEVTGSRLHVVVEDSGVGFEPQAVHADLGVGLQSVAQRLQAHYGSRATMVIASAQDEGTRIDLDLPAERVRSVARKVG